MSLLKPPKVVKLAMVDLHTHSNASDGEYSPARLVQEAAKRGLKAIALTDHDTLGGLENARLEAAQRNIHFIPGIEICIQWDKDKAPPEICGMGPGGEFHLLGLGITKPSAAFCSAVDDLARRREARNRAIFDRVLEMGVKATWEELVSLSGGHSLGRPHFATLLVKRKIVKNHEQAFARYLRPGKPLFVPKTGMDFDAALALVKESGGIPVLAHPFSLYIAWGRLPDVIRHLKDRGLMGVEAWHPATKACYCRRLEELGKELGLFITEGSDYHGAVRPERKLGSSNKGREISDTVLEAIPQLLSSE